MLKIIIYTLIILFNLYGLTGILLILIIGENGLGMRLALISAMLIVVLLLDLIVYEISSYERRKYK